MRRWLNVLWLLLTIVIFANAGIVAANDPESQTLPGKVAFAVGYGAVQSLLVLGLLAGLNALLNVIGRAFRRATADTPPELPPR